MFGGGAFGTVVVVALLIVGIVVAERVRRTRALQDADRKAGVVGARGWQATANERGWSSNADITVEGTTAQGYRFAATTYRQTDEVYDALPALVVFPDVVARVPLPAAARRKGKVRVDRGDSSVGPVLGSTMGNEALAPFDGRGGLRMHALETDHRRLVFAVTNASLADHEIMRTVDLLAWVVATLAHGGFVVDDPAGSPGA